MEEWKAIPGYEGLYEASTFGRIRTTEGKTTANARFPKRVWKQRILKQKYSTRKNAIKRDARVSLWKDGKEKTFLVARLVAMVWCSGYSDDLTVNHIDGNPENNHADNLEWISLKANIIHGYETGQYKTQIPCILVNEKTLERKWFRSRSEASRFVGRSDGYVEQCIIAGRKVISLNGEEYGFA